MDNPLSIGLRFRPVERLEGVTWGKQASDSLEGELPPGAFNPILGL